MKESSELYKNAGFMQRIGFGEKPALLIVDLQRAFTERESALGGDLDKVVENSCKILEIARERGIPVIYTRVEYENGFKDAGLWIRKVPSLTILKRGSDMVEIDPRIRPLPDEYVIVKKFASAFFATNLASYLTGQGVDTLIITGCTTSGCIRSTVIDALQHGFRPIIPVDCVGDRSQEIHDSNLIDIDAKYGDLVGLSEVIDYMDRLKD